MICACLRFVDGHGKGGANGKLSTAPTVWEDSLLRLKVDARDEDQTAVVLARRRDGRGDDEVFIDLGFRSCGVDGVCTQR